MLTHQDKIRLYLKAAEFRLPTFVIMGCMKAGVLNDPFVAKDHELKCIFFHVPKAAGKSVRKSIYQSDSFHIPAIRYKAAHPGAFEKYLKFCFV